MVGSSWASCTSNFTVWFSTVRVMNSKTLCMLYRNNTTGLYSSHTQLISYITIIDVSDPRHWYSHIIIYTLISLSFPLICSFYVSVQSSRYHGTHIWIVPLLSCGLWPFLHCFLFPVSLTFKNVIKHHLFILYFWELILSWHLKL